MTPRQGRAPLSRPAVIAAAVQLADDEGVEVVSMRRVADHLGVVPMALYKHVADKEDLLDGMIDLVLAEIAPPDPGLGDGDWQGRVRHTARAARDVVQRHPWARRTIETRTRRSAAVLGHMETVTSHFLDGGLSPDLTHHAMHALGNRIWGFSPELFDESSATVSTATVQAKPSRAKPPDPADYPGILAVSADARARRPGADGCDEEFEFDFALDLILDGIARLDESGWDSARDR